MAIEFVGTSTISGSGSSLSLSLTALTGGIASSPAEGDLVLVFIAGGSNLGNTAIGVGATGYTELLAPFGRNDSYDTTLAAYYKEQGSTPDTSVTITNSDTTFTVSARAVVLRGADSSTLSKGATQSGGNSGYPNPQPVTPTVAGSWIIDFSAAGHNQTTGTHTSSDYDTFLTAGYEGAVYDHTLSVGIVSSWVSGTFDAAVYGATYSNSAQFSWVSDSVVIAPAPEPLTEPYAEILTIGGSGTNATSYTTASVSLTAGRQALVIVYAGSVSIGDNLIAPTLSGAGQTWVQVASFTPSVRASMGDYVRISIFKADVATSNSGALTVTFDSGETQDLVTWQVLEIVGGVIGTMEGEVSTAALDTSLSLSLAGIAEDERYLAVGFWTTDYLDFTGNFTPRSGWTEIAESSTPETAFDTAIHTQQSALGGDTTASFTVSINGDLSLIAFPLQAPPTGEASLIKVWNGTSYDLKPVKVWDGAAWQTKPVKRWTGSAWELI